MITPSIDFVAALRRLALQRPFLSEAKRWCLALAEADREDIARWVAAQSAQTDAD